jgi:hypothetical protein
MVSRVLCGARFWPAYQNHDQPFDVKQKRNCEISPWIFQGALYNMSICTETSNYFIKLCVTVYFRLYLNTAYTFIVILGCYKCNECRRIFTIFTRFSKYLYIADRSFQPIKYFKMNLPIWYKNKRNQTKRIKPEETKSRRKCCISFNFVFSDLRSCKLEWRQQK